MKHAVDLNTADFGSLPILVLPHQDALVVFRGAIDLGLLKAIVLLPGARWLGSALLLLLLLLLLHSKLVGHLLAVLCLLWETLALIGLGSRARTGRSLGILRLPTLTIAL
jgi:hypothetical protein